MKTRTASQRQPAKINKKKLARLIDTLVGGDSLARERAQEALIATPDRSVVEAVAPLMKGKETATRMMAQEILKKIGDHNIEAIIALLDDENEDIRVYACEIIACLKNVYAIPALIRKTRGDADNVRNSACLALSEFDDDRAVDALIDALGDDAWVAFSAILGLARTRSARAVRPLFEMFRTGSEEVSVAACETLVGFGQPAVLNEIIETLKGWDEKRRDNYIKVMLETGEEEIFLAMKEKIGEELFGHLLSSMNYGNKKTLQTVRMLVNFGTPAACDAILDALTGIDQESEEYDEILERFTGLKDVWAGSLGSYLSKGDHYGLPIIRACVLGRVKISEDVLDASFLSASVEVRRAIVENMGSIVDGPGYKITKEAIRDPDGHVKGDAAAYAGLTGFVDLKDDIIEMARTSYPDVRPKALRALISLDATEASRLMEEFVKGGSVIDKKTFLAVADLLDNESNFPYLSRLLTDHDEGIRKAVIGVCGNFLFDERYMNIMTALLARTDVPHEALKVVKEKRLTVFRDRLVDLFADGTKPMWTRYYALSALDAFKDPTLFDLYLKGLEDESSLLKIGSVNALSGLDDPRALLYIEPFTQSEDEDIRSTAEAAVNRLENLLTGDNAEC